MTSNTPPSRSSDLEALLGVQLAGRYVLEREVGSGSTTAIFEAADTKTGRVVTFKLLRPRLAAVPEFESGFDAEIRRAAELRHPNIAAIYDWGYTEVADTRSAYVVTERLTGGSLRDMFDRGRLLSPSQALAVGLDACKALDHAHRRGNVHSELTPAKILFGDDRRLRIVDFGLSRLIGSLMWLDPSNVPNHVAWYAAPEQAIGERTTGRTDVYALSLILTEAMTGDVPFKDASTTATLNNRVGKLLPVSADMGPLASVLEHAARPEPGDRFSAAGFGKNLVHTAARLPRPEPLPLLASGVFDTPADRLREPSDPTGGVTRPGAELDDAERLRGQGDPGLIGLGGVEPDIIEDESAARDAAELSTYEALSRPSGRVGPDADDFDIGDQLDDDTFDGRAEFDRGLDDAGLDAADSDDRDLEASDSDADAEEAGRNGRGVGAPMVPGDVGELRPRDRLDLRRREQDRLRDKVDDQVEPDISVDGVESDDDQVRAISGRNLDEHRAVDGGAGDIDDHLDAADSGDDATGVDVTGDDVTGGEVGGDDEVDRADHADDDSHLQRGGRDDAGDGDGFATGAVDIVAITVDSEDDADGDGFATGVVDVVEVTDSPGVVVDVDDSGDRADDGFATGLVDVVEVTGGRDVDFGGADVDDGDGDAIDDDESATGVVPVVGAGDRDDLDAGDDDGPATGLVDVVEVSGGRGGHDVAAIDDDESATGVVPVVGAGDRDDLDAGDDDGPATGLVDVVEVSGGRDVAGRGVVAVADDDDDEFATGVVPVVGPRDRDDHDAGDDDGFATGVVPVIEVGSDDATGVVPVIESEARAAKMRSTSTTSPTDPTGRSGAAGYGGLDYRDPGYDNADGYTSDDAVGASDPNGLEPDRHKRRRFPIKTMFALLVVIGLVAVGLVAFRLLSSTSYLVPNLVGTPVDEAKQLIAPNGWVVTESHERSDDEPEAGDIIRTSPPAGEEVAEGEPFHMVVSDGPIQRELPDLSGVEANEAQATLQELRMRVTVQKAHDDDVPAGIVISWNVPDQDLKPGDLVDPGTDVILVVSEGPAPRSVPNLIGVPLEQARAQLTELGLTLTVNAERPDATAPAGAVASQSVEPSAMVERGTDIQVEVSTGNVAIFPDLSAVEGFEAAKQALEAAGFQVEFQLGDETSTNLVYFIDGETPGPGNEYPLGTLVEVESR